MLKNQERQIWKIFFLKGQKNQERQISLADRQGSWKMAYIEKVLCFALQQHSAHIVMCYRIAWQTSILMSLQGAPGAVLLKLNGKKVIVCVLQLAF